MTTPNPVLATCSTELRLQLPRPADDMTPDTATPPNVDKFRMRVTLINGCHHLLLISVKRTYPCRMTYGGRFFQEPPPTLTPLILPTTLNDHKPLASYVQLQPFVHAHSQSSFRDLVL